MSPKSLSNFTTLHVGGPAQKLIRATTETELIAAIDEADSNNQPLLILGGGSNVLVGDDGFQGTVILVETKGNSYEIDACSGGLLTVAAGEDWDLFVEFTIEKGLANLESLSGIPGTIGGAPIQNIGAYGHEVGEVIARLRTYDRTDKKVVTFTADQCDFSYRNSKFKKVSPRYVVLDVTFHLRNGEMSLPVGYAELAKELGVEIGARAPIANVREAVLRLRQRKGMLVNQNIWSAGSFFTNPILSEAEASKLPVDAPRWPQANGDVKTSAAWLMENAGVSRGDQLHGAQISPLHVLALTNSGSATAADLIELARFARAKVKDKFGITLEPEVRLVGVEL